MIEIQHLTKQYGNHLAVSDLSCTIESGRIYGLLGPNGAGKSTTMNIMTGCLAATEGEVRISGHDIFEEAEAAKKLIGYLPEQPPLYRELTPREYLHFVASAKGVKRGEIRGQIDEVIRVAGVDEVQNRVIRHLSKGYCQRVGIAQALLGKPQVVILDEPTVGLDPLQIIEIRDLIKDLGKTHTVILSSHILSEVRAVCDTIMIISKGKLVASDTPDHLESLFAGNSTLSLRARASEAEIRAGLAGIGEISGMECTPGPDGEIEVQIQTQGDVDIAEPVFFAFSRMQRPILRMQVNRASLEDVFLELTGEKEALEEAEIAIEKEVE